jgi:two-component SAPR family response regulator
LTNAALSDIALSYLFLGDPISASLVVEQMETQTLSEGTVGYERAWHDLTHGLILLSQNRANEAETYLVEIEAALHTTDFKRGSIQAKLRLAACRVVQKQSEQAIRLLREIVSLLTTYRSYTYLVQIELQWLPMLLEFVQNDPQLASLRALLGLAEPSQVREVAAPSSIQVVSNAPRLAIYAFGEPMVVLDEQPIKHWRMARAAELFFFLLDSAHPIRKEAILAALWPECDEQTSPVFHNTVYQLRKLLGEACLVFHSTGYRLDLAACYGESVFYDVQAFEQYRIEAAQAMALENEALAKEMFLKMVQLYRGDYGQSFYNDWCIFRRDELRTAYLEARRALAQITWNAEAWSECADHWRHILRLDNCFEEAHYGLMRCYLRQGKRGSALRQYHSCQKSLQDELGVQPGQAMQNLYQRLIARGNSNSTA